MTAFIQYFSEIAGQFGLSLLFVLFLVGFFGFVMTRNYRRMIREDVRLDLLEGERLLDRLDVTGLVASTRTVVTDRRIMQVYLGWLFSRRKVFAVAWVDAHSVAFRRSVPWIALVAAALVYKFMMPVAFLLVVWCVDSKLYAIYFDTPFAQMPVTKVRVRSRKRSDLQRFTRFYWTSHAIWSRVRTERANAHPTPIGETAVTHETDFALGRSVWASILLVMACAFVQRILGDHVGIDSLVFGPVYLALPVIAARFSRRDGFWVALLGFVGLLTMKFPGSMLNDGGIPQFVEYFGVLVTLLLMSEIASAISQGGRPFLSPFTLLLWIPYVVLHMPTVALDLRLYAITVGAIGVASFAAIALSPEVAQTQNKLGLSSTQ